MSLDLIAQYRAELAVADPDRAVKLLEIIALLEARRAPFSREELVSRAADDVLNYLALDSPNRACYATAWLEILMAEPVHP